jgi:hypothetical protein
MANWLIRIVFIATGLVFALVAGLSIYATIGLLFSLMTDGDGQSLNGGRIAAAAVISPVAAVFFIWLSRRCFRNSRQYSPEPIRILFPK